MFLFTRLHGVNSQEMCETCAILHRFHILFISSGCTTLSMCIVSADVFYLRTSYDVAHSLTASRC